MRWSYESPFQTADGKQAQFDPTVTDPLTGLKGAIVHNPGALAKQDLNNFQPRIGVAYNFRPKWVFRGNFGMITADLLTSTLNNNFEEYLATASLQAPPGDPRTIFALSQGPPSFKFNVEPGRFGAVHRNQLQRAQRHLVRSQHADAVHVELVRRLPVSDVQQLAHGSPVPGFIRRRATQ